MSSTPWLTHYPPHVPADFAPSNRAVHDLFFDAAEKFSARAAFSFMGRETSYADLAATANAFAAALQKAGLKKGDRLALCLPNCPYYPIAYYGALKAGLVVVNCNPLYTEAELKHLLKDSGAKAIFTLTLKQMLPKVVAAGKGKLVIAADLASTLPAVKGLLFNLLKRGEIAKLPMGKKFVKYADFIRPGGAPKPVKINPKQDLALLQYTGGTTGVPKGAMLTHRNIVANTEQASIWVGHENLDKARFLAVLPFFHVFAMTAIMNMGFGAGSTIIALPRFDLKATLKAIHTTKPTLFAGVPTLYNAINTCPDLKKYDLSSIRFCISGGAGLPRTVKEAFEKLTGCVLVEGYGLSEASPVLACNPLVEDGKIGSIGLPFPGTELEIRDLENPSKKLPVGEKGELVGRGPQVMPGYWQNEKATKDVLLKGGWLRTGDVGYMAEDGYFYLVDRAKDLILVNGYNVYPRAVESAFYKHPAVAEVSVIAIPDDEKGEVPKAFVALKDGHKATADELLSFAKKHLNPLEKPAAVEIRESLPKTMVGKLSKKELVAEEAAKREGKAHG